MPLIAIAARQKSGGAQPGLRSMIAAQCQRIQKAAIHGMYSGKVNREPATMQVNIAARPARPSVHMMLRGAFGESTAVGVSCGIR